MAWKRTVIDNEHELVGSGIDAGYRLVAWRRRVKFLRIRWVVYFDDRIVGPAQTLEGAHDLVNEHARMTLLNTMFNGGDANQSCSLSEDGIILKKRRLVLGYKNDGCRPNRPVFRGWLKENKKQSHEFANWESAKTWLIDLQTAT